MSDLVLQDTIGRQANRVACTLGFEELINLGIREGCVTPEIQMLHDAPVTRNHRLQQRAPAVSTMDVARSQRAPFDIAELIEHEQRVVILLRQKLVSSGWLSELPSRSVALRERGMSEDRLERFGAYVEALAEVIGHADRGAPLRDYCRGLLLPGEGKSVEPIAAVTAPARVSAKHQSLLHFVANAPWSNERVLGRIQELILPLIEGSGAIEAWIIDDTGFPKGRYSVG